MKSMLSLYVALGLTKGQLFGVDCEPRNVVYVDRENPDTIVKSRANRMGLKELDNENNLWYWGMWHQTPSPPFATDSLYLRLAEEIEKPVFVFDSLMRFHSKDENDAGQMSVITMAFRELCARGATVILLHHKGKARLEGPTTPFRGSSEISAACDIGYSVDKKLPPEGSGQNVIIELNCFKNRFEEEKSLKFKFHDDAVGRRFEPMDFNPRMLDKDAETIKAFVMTKPGLSASQYSGLTKINLTKTSKILTEDIYKFEDAFGGRKYYLKS